MLNNFFSDHGPVSVVVPVVDMPDKLVVGSGKDVILVNWNGDKDQKLVSFGVVSSLQANFSNIRTNDGKVDSSGRFWIGKLEIL